MDEAERASQNTERHLDISANVLCLLEQQAHDFRQAARISDGLFTYLSHAGRTSLTLTLDTLERAIIGEFGPVSPLLQAHLERMNENARRLLGDIELADEISLLEAGEMQRDVRRQDLVAFLRKLTQRFQQPAKWNKIDLRFKTELDRLDFPFCTNTFSKAFSNLILFALKHTPLGGAVRVAVEREGLFPDAFVTVTIMDTGSRSAAARLVTFFDGVQPVGIDSSDERLDLGLLLACTLLIRSGHDVSLASNSGSAVAVTVRLQGDGSALVPDGSPADAPFFAEGDALPGPVELFSSVALPDRAEPPEQEPEILGRPIVLLVNGSYDMRSYLRSCLMQYRIVEAVEGAEALRIIHKQRPDLIICDLVLPGLGGADLLRTLKADPHLAAIPFILITNRISEEQKVDMLEAGAAAYLIEPFRVAELQAMVHNLLKLSEREKKMQTLAHQAQLAMLRYQLNPHFLFNALNAIRSLTLSDVTRSRQLVTALSEYLRYSLRTANDLEASLQEEVTSVLSYLEIEKIRFEQDLEVCFEIDPEATGCTVPGMLLQPLVENAIKYGMETSPMPLRIQILGTIQDHRLHLEVINTGRWVPTDETPGRSTGIGLRNLRQRLDQYYPEQHHFDISEQNGSVKVTLDIDLE